MIERAVYEVVYAQVQGVTTGKYWLLGVSKNINGWTIRRRMTAARPLVEFAFWVDEPSAFRIAEQVIKNSELPVNYEAFRDLVKMLETMIYATRDFIGR